MFETFTAHPLIFAPALAHFAQNPSIFEVHVPEFGSYFQSFLPYMIKEIPPDSPIPKMILPTNFPPPVNGATIAKKVITVVNPNLPVSPKCASCLRVVDYSSIRGSARRWISTGVYAKQGEQVTVTIPDNVKGKFGLQVGTHTDDLLGKNLDRWIAGESENSKRAAQVTQYYEDSIIEEKTRIMTPYGRLIYVVIDDYNDIGNFDLVFENIIESPRFLYGSSSNADWSEAYQASSAPMVELELPGIIFTIPRTTIDELNPDMEAVASEWQTVMDTFSELQGYVKTVPQRYATDVEITGGGAHAGYPIMDVPLESYLYDLSGKEDTLNSGEATGCFHEIGHNIQDRRWTTSKLVEVTNNLWPAYINEKLYKRHSYAVNPWYIEQFREAGRNFDSLDIYALLNILLLVKDECGWETYIRFFKYYQEEVPDVMSPNTDENVYSTMVKVLSLMCNKNLVPFFQWWKWPVMEDAVEDTKDLPGWVGIIVELEASTLSVCNGWDDCCTSDRRCGEGEGDCDADSHCKEGLSCGTNNCPVVTNGTFTIGDDCCHRPACTGGDSCCTAAWPCGEQEGDCDEDYECKEGLKCGSDNCPQDGSFESDDDCCYKE